MAPKRKAPSGSLPVITISDDEDEEAVPPTKKRMTGTLLPVVSFLHTLLLSSHMRLKVGSGAKALLPKA